MLTHASGIAAALAVLALPAMGQTALETALATGTRLSGDEIAARIVDHTITARAGERTFLFHYGPDNRLTGRKTRHRHVHPH